MASVTSFKINETHDECSICLETITPKERLNPIEITQLKCHHFFHSECIENWLEVSPSCPDCRAASCLIGRIKINATDTVSSLYDKIATTYQFHRPRLRLFCNGSFVPEASYISNSFVDITINESKLASGSQIYSLESRQTPHHQEFPPRKITLEIVS